MLPYRVTRGLLFLPPSLSFLVVGVSVPRTHSHYLLLRFLDTLVQTSFLAFLFLGVPVSIFIRCCHTACMLLWRGNA